MDNSMIVETTGDRIHIEVVLPVAARQVWTLLTEKQHIATWWGNHVDLEARPQGTLLESWADAGHDVKTSGVVTRCDPPVVLEMTWADDAWPADTRVGFRLSEYGDKTRLVLDHSGWSVHPAGEREELIAAHARGWSRYLARLAEYAAEVGPSERERRQHHSPEPVGGQGFAHDEGA